MSDQSPTPGFTPKQLDKTVVAIPLLDKLEQEKRQMAADPDRPPALWKLVIDVNLEYREGRRRARNVAEELIERAVASHGRNPSQGLNKAKSERSEQYLFASLEGEVIREVVRLNDSRNGKRRRLAVDTVARPIFRIWPDFTIRPLINKSMSTVKADAARVSFSALGEGIVWAVLDSGVARHPQFDEHGNLEEDGSLKHRDFTDSGDPLEDGFGHGTHVAGIIAGDLRATTRTPLLAASRHRDEDGEVVFDVLKLPRMTGMAPQCRILSLKVLDDAGEGEASNLIAALEYIQELNGYGRRLRVHGVNMSVGYSFEPEWFACGQSPLCVEVDQLVRSGVAVVVAAGNTGYGTVASEARGPVQAGMGVTINDPGNADLAITVGSTHRDMPHVYGVSYFSSKGPTGDGRDKPDLVAPGEKILSCAAGAIREEAKASAERDCQYVENSGTSMAAPHVSGVIAAFLSTRQEFIGRPDRVKEIFTATATDLRRNRHFQGHGLIDVMRAIQSV